MRCSSRKPISLLDAMPDVVRSVLPDFEWSRERLRGLQLPAERIATEDLRWHLTLPMWSFKNVPFTLSPEQVRADPGRYWEHYARTMAADLRFPIHALERPSGRLTVLDGIHRLLKADLLGHTTVRIKKISTDRLDEIAA